MRDIGKNIKDLRIRAKMTQEELAEKLFVTRQTVSNYEIGKSRPDVDMIVMIGEVLAVDANTVIYGAAADRDKEQKQRRVIILTGVLIVLALAMYWFDGLTRELRNDRWILLPFAIVRFLGLPGLWLFAGWWMMDTLSLFVDFKRWNQPYIRYIRQALLCILVICFLVLLTQIVFSGIGDYLSLTTDGFALTYPNIPLITHFVYINTYRYPMLYAFFGIVFHLIGFPKRKK